MVDRFDEQNYPYDTNYDVHKLVKEQREERKRLASQQAQAAQGLYYDPLSQPPEGGKKAFPFGFQPQPQSPPQTQEQKSYPKTYGAYPPPEKKNDNSLSMREKRRNEFNQLLQELQAIDFSIVELNEFLDTHPNDMQALQQFNQLAQQKKQLTANFELKFGPLMNFGQSYSRYPWQWIQTPWPWQV